MLHTATVNIHGVDIECEFTIGYEVERETQDDGSTHEFISDWFVTDVNETFIPRGPNRTAWKQLLDEDEIYEKIKNEIA